MYDTRSVKVAVLSQPSALVNVAFLVPDVVKVKPFHVYGSCVGIIVRLVTEVVAF